MVVKKEQKHRVILHPSSTSYAERLVKSKGGIISNDDSKGALFF
jgi:hypothetical protein